MRFIGVDLAWTGRGGTGLCVIEGGRVEASTRVQSDEELLNWLRPLVEEDVLVAIDAPLIVRNRTGRRRAERLISRCFGAYHASAHSANLGLPAFIEGVRGEWLASMLGLDVDPVFPPRLPVRRAIEVYPHTAIVALFGLATTLKYKAKGGRTLATRAAAFTQLMQHVEALHDADPPVDVRTAPRWAELSAAIAVPSSGAELARLEDEIDAYVCAYTALYYWTHGTSRCRVAGDVDSGYIVTPVTPAQAACLDRAMAEGRVVHVPARDLPSEEPTERRHLTTAEYNAERVRALLTEARVTRTPHVTQLVVDGERGIVVLVTGEAIELRLPTVEWTAGTHAPAETSRLWRRLNADPLSDAELAAEIERARGARAAEFIACRYCGRRTPLEHRVGEDVCHACAEQHENVVF
jgi:predicted RNase H-like nuclease